MTLTEQLYTAYAQSDKTSLVAFLKQYQAEMIAHFDDQMNNQNFSGLQAMYNHADETDALLSALLDVLKNTFNCSQQITLVAVGGYGRKELAPYSDMDLLFLMNEEAMPKTSELISTMVSLLWDMGLKVGQSVRTIDECFTAMAQDITITTALLESRFITGDKNLYHEFERQYRDYAQETAKQFFDAKMTERSERYKKMGQSKYMLEPNVKEGRGGLRDLHFLFWLIKYLFSITDLYDLVSDGFLSSSACFKFLKAHRFLTTVRCHLHLLNHKPGDILTFENQKQIAEKMGYVCRSGQFAVERFMKHYYLVCKDVSDLSWQLIVMMHDILSDEYTTNEIPDYPEYVLINNRIALKDDIDLSHSPLLLLKTFHLKQILDLPIHPKTLQQITENAKTARQLRQKKRAGTLFLKMLTYPKAEVAMRGLLETGVLAYYIPEFSHIIAQVQFDLYHVYTTDEHSLKTLGLIDTADQIVLATAALFHDVGKGRGGKHEIIGAELVKKITANLCMSPAEANDVVWLVEHHILMANTAFKRDIFDPQTIDDFVKIVQSPERLRKLYALTKADIQAVGPNVWTSFKDNLLSNLFSMTLKAMQGQDFSIQQLTQNELELEKLKDTHDYQFKVSVDKNKEFSEFNVLAPDYDGLFAHITGVMASNDVSIVSAKIMTLDNQMALDTFLITEANHTAVESEKKLARIQKLIQEKADVSEKLEQKLSQQKQNLTEMSVPLQVFIDNTASKTATLIEINATDKIGFLYQATSLMTKLKLNIISAHIYTYGSHVVDVFYVSDLNNKKVSNPDKIQKELYNGLS